MKLFLPLLLSFIGMSSVNAQVTSVTETFDVTCATTGQNLPLDWSEVSFTEPTSALGWGCAPLDGRWGTGAQECNSYYGGHNYSDTAWLFTPEIDISGYPDSIFLRFDSKFEFIAARLSVLISSNYSGHGANPDTPYVTWEDAASATNPVINPNADSAAWVTHWVNLTGFKPSGSVYVAFRYISSTTAGGIWTIDNVFSTVFGVGVKDVTKEDLPVTIQGNSTTEQISLTVSVTVPGPYDIEIYDNVGRKVLTQKIEAQPGKESITLSELSLHPGMYIVKMSNGTQYGIAKTIVL